ncbi:GNAT family N-acetyltransferase [Schinkia azotoformans]|nr:GNAT family N-acetyltransferase [Schinkia azotoformans]MEC1638702.1 GNAT family N-acetyltransferase [Schinkia azotoformans]MEC1946667.1 GNAT family N-acetyltransferase [Schinkia azotoformans]
MRIRLFVKEDISACTTLFIEVFNREPWNDCWTGQLATEYFEDVLHTPGFEGFVMEVDSGSDSDSDSYNQSGKPAIVGFVIGTRKKWWSGDIYYLYEMCMDESYQGEGIGSKLMEDAKSALVSKGFSSIVLLTERTFPAAHFYQKHGFIESPETRFYFCSL